MKPTAFDGQLEEELIVADGQGPAEPLGDIAMAAQRSAATLAGEKG